MKAIKPNREIPSGIKADATEIAICRAWEVFEALRQAAADNHLQDMSLEKINAEIKAVRDERKGRMQ